MFNKFNPRVPVVAPDGESLMPTKASRARRWIKQGKAVPRRTKTGVFYVQLVNEPSGRKKQNITLVIDIGSKYDGYAVSGPKEVVLTGMLELPSKIVKKLERRRQQRRNRRYRKTRRRKPRFDNRKRPEGWIAPSQLAKVQTRMAIVRYLKKIIPIKDVIIEEVSFNHFKNRKGKYFSTAEIGKTKFRNWLKSNFKNVEITTGFITNKLRNKFNLSKTTNKSARNIFSHVTDVLAHLFNKYNLRRPQNFLFYIWKRLELPRRQLHKFQYEKGGIRKPYGGTKALDITKGTIVKYIGKSKKLHNKLFRTGGSTKGKLSLHTHDLNYKRITQSCLLKNIKMLFHTLFLWELQSVTL